jgi:hypothetical protein
VRISLPSATARRKPIWAARSPKGRRSSTTAQQEQLIEADVRNTMQSLRSAEARLQAAAARASRPNSFTKRAAQFRAARRRFFSSFSARTS